MKRYKWFLIFAVVFFANSTYLFSQDEDFGWIDEELQMDERIDQDVPGLSDEVKEKIRSLRFKFKQGRVDKEAEIKKRRLELQFLMGSNEIDEKRVNQLAKEIGKLSSEIIQGEIGHHVEMAKLVPLELRRKHMRPRPRMIGRRKMMRERRGPGFGPRHRDQ